MDKAELRRRVELVKEFRAKYGEMVGTALAYKVAMGEDSMEHGISCIVEKVNESLGDKAPYPATLERVLGLSSALGVAYDKACDEGYIKDKLLQQWFGCNVLMRGHAPGRVDYSIEAGVALPYFEEANKAGASRDFEFGTVLAERAQERALAWRKKVLESAAYGHIKDDPVALAIFDTYTADVIEHFQKIVWGRQMSPENAGKVKKDLLDYYRGYISTKAIIRRIMNDGLERHIEYQRMVIDMMIKEEDWKSYDSMVNFAKKLKKMAEDQLGVVDRAKGWSGAFEAGFTPGVLGNMDSTAHHMLIENIFILRALAGNKKYVQEKLGEIA